MTTIENIILKKLIKELKNDNISMIDDSENLDNICFINNKGDIWKCYKNLFFRKGGMCKTFTLTKKKNEISVIDITDEMFYDLMKCFILNKLK